MYVSHRPARPEVPKHGAHGFLSPRSLHRHLPQTPERGRLTLPAFGRRRARRRSTEAGQAGCCRVSRKPVFSGARGRSLGDGARGGLSYRPLPPGWLRPGQRCGWARARAPALGKRRRRRQQRRRRRACREGEAACFLARLAELTDGPGLFPRRPRALGLRSRRGRFSRHLDVAGRLDEGPSRLVMLTAASAISRRAALWYEPRVFVSGRLPAPEPLSAGHGTLTVNARAAIFA